MSQDELLRQHYEADREVARKALEDARKELADLDIRQPTSEAEKAALAARKAELERRSRSLELAHTTTNQILTWMKELAELKNRNPKADGERRALEDTKRELHANLERERKRARDLKHTRKKRANPEQRNERAKYERDLRRRLLRTAEYLADTKRPRDALELLENELVDRLQEPPSESREERVHHLRERIDTMKKLVEARRERERVRWRRHSARSARGKLIAEKDGAKEHAQEIGKLDKDLEQIDRELRALRVEIVQLCVRQRLLAQLGETPWAHGPGSVDEAQLREFERQLTEGLVNDQQLAGIERALDAMDLTDAEWEQAVLDEADDVDETLREWEELLHERPSPARAAGLQSSFERLQQKLREERVAVEAAMSALANEYASIQTTQARSSSGPIWQDRLRAIHQEQLDLRADWRARLSARLDNARQQLEDMQRVARLRDEGSEAELAREIALLEHELQGAGR